MTRYAITGTPDISPDCTTPDTGEPAGMYQEQLYWTWTNEAGTWFLWNDPTPGFGGWRISSDLGGGINPGDAYWRYPYLVGDYEPRLPATGTATVAEYVPPTSDPRLRGVLKLLITHVNGTELNPSKRFELEFDS